MKRRSLETVMLGAWYGRAPWLRLLRPLSWLYTQVARRRRQRFLDESGASWQPPVPLLVVGNITLGGTGKTPMTLWLIEWLAARGIRAGVVSRGYGAKPPSLPWRVRTDSDDASIAGDEPLLLARRSGVPVVIDPDRVRAVQHLLEHEPVDLIISDDGLQHYRLGRHLELVMLDQARGVGNGRCLPEGPLREPPERLATVDFIVRNGATEDSADGYAMQLVPSELINLRTGQRCPATQWQGPRQVVGLAGIGNPERFFRTLESLSFEVERQPFADHAQYTASVLNALSAGRPLIMTEKDAVKCAAFAEEQWWYLSVDARPSEAFRQALESRLATLLPVR